MQVTGNISYNGRTLKEFLPRRTATFVEQSDTVRASGQSGLCLGPSLITMPCPPSILINKALHGLQHIGELTVRETLNFAARCQGAGLQKSKIQCSRAEMPD